MKLAGGFRALAREVLQGRWEEAVLVGLLAGVLGGAPVSLFSFF